MPRPLPEGAEDTIKYKSPGKDFVPFAKRLRRILRDAIRMADDEKEDHGREAEGQGEAGGEGGRAHRVVLLGSREKNCARLLKRLRRERGCSSRS